MRYYSTSNDNVQTRAINPIYGHGEAIWEAKDLTYPLTDELLPLFQKKVTMMMPLALIMMLPLVSHQKFPFVEL